MIVSSYLILKFELLSYILLMILIGAIIIIIRFVFNLFYCNNIFNHNKYIDTKIKLLTYRHIVSELGLVSISIIVLLVLFHKFI